MEYNLKTIKLSHFSVHLKLTQYCKSTILQFKRKKDSLVFQWVVSYR